jgi:RNA polymerase sigma factor for flagellar operon FliA
VENEDQSVIASLWADYKATASRDARDKLIVHYSPLVKYVAGRVSVGLPQNIEQADLVSYGIFGLIDAIDKFDPERAIKFETYAIARIKGAIIDELRSIDWVPRSVRAKARAPSSASSPSTRCSRAASAASPPRSATPSPTRGRDRSPPSRSRR